MVAAAIIGSTPAGAAGNSTIWNIGDIVDVKARTWAGINRQGGVGTITKINYAADQVTVESIDVKYTVNGGFDTNLDLDFVSKQSDDNDNQHRSRRRRCAAPGIENQPAAAAMVVPTKQKNKPKKKKDKTKKKMKVSGKHVASKATKKYIPKKQPVSPTMQDDFRRKKDVPTDNKFDYSTASNRMDHNSFSPMISNSNKKTPKTVAMSEAYFGNESKEMDIDNDNRDLKDVTRHEELELIQDKHKQSKSLEKAAKTDKNPIATKKKRKKHPIATVQAAKQGQGYDSDMSALTCDESVEFSTNATTVTLNSIHRDGVKKANDFIKEVVDDNRQGNDKDDNTKQQEERRYDPERLAKFSTELLEVLSSGDEPMVAISDIVEKINDIAGDNTQYSDDEVEMFVNELCMQNKIMQSDGFICQI